MNPIALPLTARIFGEWLAALGLLRVAGVLSPQSTLHFDDEGRAILTTDADEPALVRKIIASAKADAIVVRLFTETNAPGVSTVRIGEKLFTATETSLDDPTAAKNADAKAGMLLRFKALDDLEVSHFLGEAMTTCGDLRSPLKMWAGQVSLPTILQHLQSLIAGHSEGMALTELLGIRLRHTQRLRFDHDSEQFVEDGGYDREAGRPTRPVVEWLGLLGLSFFPAEAGFASMLTSPRHLHASLWRSPLTPRALLIALHSGAVGECHSFAIASDGKFKKIRPTGAGRESLASIPT